MRESDSPRPAIFAMSNPTMNGLILQALSNFLLMFSAPSILYEFSFLYVTAECTAADAFKHAGENIVFASGSPFENVDLGTSLPVDSSSLPFS